MRRLSDTLLLAMLRAQRRLPAPVENPFLAPEMRDRLEEWYGGRALIIGGTLFVQWREPNGERHRRPLSRYERLMWWLKRQVPAP